MSALRGSAFLLFVVAAVLLTGCSSEPAESSIEVVVTQVVGGPGEVESFIILDADGASHRFLPVAGLMCDDVPIDHLRTHLVERDVIMIEFEASVDGAGRTATKIIHLTD
jgi:hypothetical protein